VTSEETQGSQLSLNHSKVPLSRPLKGEVPYLDGTQIKLTQEEGAFHLRIEILDDQCILSGRIKRIFPLSSANEYFSVQNSDDEEVAILRSLNGLDPESRALVDKELDRRYFSPLITKINSVKQVPGMWSFDVETNRGPIVFHVRNWRENSYEVETNRWHITSVDGQRFEILDLDALDKPSQKLVENLF